MTGRILDADEVRFVRAGLYLLSQACSEDNDLDAATRKLLSDERGQFHPPNAAWWDHIYDSLDRHSLMLTGHPPLKSQPPEGPHSRPLVSATVRDDMSIREVDFFVNQWLVGLSDEDLLYLADDGYKYCEMSDCAAEFMSDYNPDVHGFFIFLSQLQESDRKSAVGFECSINEDELRSWVEVHRPRVDLG
jgi:hypothetical protein